VRVCEWATPVSDELTNSTAAHAKRVAIFENMMET
jgi:hypothetical protein